jgi:two-component system, cell cycle sensor histidine kinase and response regulator CckA
VALGLSGTDGPRWIADDHTPLVANGEIVGVIRTVRDITPRKVTEQALLESQERTLFALEAARAGVWENNLATGKVTWSPTLYTLFGMTPADFDGSERGFFERVVEDDREAVRAAFDRAIHDVSDFAAEFRVSWPDGSVRWHLARARVLADASGRPQRILGVDIDITERRSLEAQFRQSQKMEAVGQLAGGVAHDFNNLLTAILGYARFLEEDLQIPEQRRDAGEIIKSAERAALLSKQLLAFSRRQVVETALVDVNTLIVNMADMLRRLIGEHISTATVLRSEGAQVRADRGQLEQVLMNLVVNARDAMPGGGAIRIETSAVLLDETYALGHMSVKPGSYLMLAVSDTGTGMTDEVKARIFEPFFTTKGRDKGTGLGLSTVYGIVSKAGGYVWVYSEIGRGTTFKVYLPCVDRDAAAPTPAALPRPRTRGGQETVLIVEDEDAVRLLARTILERAGYRVLDAPEPGAALAAFDEAGAAVDLLLSDVIMPGGTGPELFRRLAARQPSLRALMMSGYTGNAVIDARQLEAGAAFLEKPFTAEGLRRKVREVLDR